MLVKPVSGACNMSCDYCFYKNHPGHERGVMTRDTVDALVKAAFEYATAPVSFAFQGGEPSLAGLEFYEYFLNAVKRENRSSLPVYWSIQTNGYKPDKSFCEFIAENKFLVGISLDGHGALHNAFRHSVSGEDTYSEVLRGIDAYRRAGAEVNILSVVTAEMCREPGFVWRELEKLGLPCLQFIPCLDSPGGENYSPTSEQYENFLVKTFDCWTEHIRRGDYISVRLFDNFISLALGYPCELCSSAGGCTNQFVVEADGSVYPCDFYVEDRYFLGNVGNSSVDELNRAASCFIESRPKIPDGCRKCRWKTFCGGGCRRELNSEGKFRYCRAYENFFARREAVICEIAKLAKKGQIKSVRMTAYY